jgi:SAM-dependent MidA family methyltransferase
MIAALNDNTRAMPASLPAGMPVPDALSAEHSLRCAKHIQNCIEVAGASISFAEFMQLALYAPALGYYVAGAHKLGRGGDFVTAPEVSPLFGRVLAAQCAPVLNRIAASSILEIGAGSGRLAVDLLTKLEELSALPSSYQILEVSAELKQRQSALLRSEVPQLYDRVSWLDQLPGGHRGVVIANEVLDALPFERFIAGQSARQQRVVSKKQGFAWASGPAPARLQSAIDSLQQELGAPLPDGYTSELCLAARPFVIDLLAALESGVVFLFDYGLSQREYYAADRAAGWLRCHFRQYAHNEPLILPGIQDITSWVNFTSAASAAVESGATIAGYVSQAHFLMAGGLANELRDPDPQSEREQLQLSAAVKTLTLPGEMGERFKCLGLLKAYDDPPLAFSLADRTHTL